MRYLYVLMLFMFPTALMAYYSGEDIRSCGIVASDQALMQGRLSDHWAQELIGADLMRLELKQTPAPNKRLFVAVFDSDKENHNIKVRNLISDEGPHAVLPELEYQISLFNVDFTGERQAKADLMNGSPPPSYYKTRALGDYHVLSRVLKASGVIPSFINNSMVWARDMEEGASYESFKTISPPAVLVIPSGNLFPQHISEKQIRASRNLHAVIVGNLSPDGIISIDSIEGSEVHILAPAGFWLTSAGWEGEYQLFGGTSGATALTTGVLAGFEWLSGYSLEPFEAKILLEKTAIPTVHSIENPQRNGAGLLNGYKIAAVAQALKQKCHGKDSFCFKREIRNEENYLFSTDPSLMEDLEKAFPFCSSRSFPEPISCETKQRAFHDLRRAVSLSPERRDLWEFLSCVYKEGEFDQNSLLLERIARASHPDAGDLDKWLSEFLSQFDERPFPHSRFSAFLLNALWKAEQTAILEELIQHENPNLRRSLALSAWLTEDPYIESLLQHMSQDPTPEVRQAVAFSAGKRGGFSDLLLLRELSHDEDSEVRSTVAVAMGRMLAFPKEAVALLREISLDESSNVRRRTVRSAGIIGGPSAFDLLKDMYHQNKENSNIRTVTVWAAVMAGEGTRLSDFLWEASHDKSMEVRRAVAYSSIEIPQTEALLADMSQDISSEIREVVVMMAGLLLNPTALLIIKRMCGDQDLIVRQRAIRTAQEMEKILRKQGFVLEEAGALCIQDNTSPTAQPT